MIDHSVNKTLVFCFLHSFLQILCSDGFIALDFPFVIAMIDQTRQQTKYCLGLSTQSSKKGYGNSNNEDEESAFEKLRKDIEANQDNALSLCTEKVLLARQAGDLVSCFLFLSLSLNYYPRFQIAWFNRCLFLSPLLVSHCFFHLFLQWAILNCVIVWREDMDLDSDYYYFSNV